MKKPEGASIEIFGRYYPEDELPFEPARTRNAGVGEALASLSFLRVGAGLDAIIQAKLAGLSAQGKRLRPGVKRVLHVSDMATVIAYPDADDEGWVGIVLRERVWQVGGEYKRALTDFVSAPEYETWDGAFVSGVRVKARQLPKTVMIHGFVTKPDPERGWVSNLLYAVKQGREPHEAELRLQEQLKKLRSGADMARDQPRMVLGQIFAREIEDVEK
jgi:hypothetical protein